MKDYRDFYLKFDVLLSSVFEIFRNNRLKNYRLCPRHCLTAPILKQEAMLNMRKVELELISDTNMYLFFETVTRGEVSYNSKRYLDTQLQI